MRIRKGKVIPRDDGKRIEELIGNATTRTKTVSFAKMLAPPGWSEPFQNPRFDEIVAVLRGELTLVIGKKRERIAAGELGWIARGQRVQYRNDARVACEYFSVCVPAFLPKLAGIEPAAPSSNHVELNVSHPRGKAHAKELARLAVKLMDALSLSGCELSLSLVGDQAIRRINRTWREKDQPTDVLSFPAGEMPKGAPGPRLLGDVILSLDTAARLAKQDGRPIEQELARYLAHGILHLLGHDHHAPGEAKRMAEEENRLLGAQGMLETSGTVPARLTHRSARREA